MSGYNPYLPIDVMVNGSVISARPYEFDSDVADQMDMTNAKGEYVKPSKVSTCCPDCGCGLEFDVILPDPPFPMIEFDCYNCNIKVPMSDPFIHPVNDARVSENMLDPLYSDKPLAEVMSSVADRFDISSDIKITVDDTNNTQDVIDRNELVASVEITTTIEPKQQETVEPTQPSYDIGVDKASGADFSAEMSFDSSSAAVDETIHAENKESTEDDSVSDGDLSPSSDVKDDKKAKKTPKKVKKKTDAVETTETPNVNNDLTDLLGSLE